jgi:hypothetical protein
VKINNNPVVRTQDAKYLRMYLDGKLTWRNHVEKTVGGWGTNYAEKSFKKHMG